MKHMHKMAFTQEKAKKVLGEERPTLRGKPISKKQRGLLGLIAGGGKPSRLAGAAKRRKKS